LFDKNNNAFFFSFFFNHRLLFVWVRLLVWYVGQAIAFFLRAEKKNSAKTGGKKTKIFFEHVIFLTDTKNH